MLRTITLLLATITIIFNTSFSQKLDHDLTSPWFFGANVGATWNHTDVKNKTYYGWGLVLGRSFNRNYANLFSYDLKFRYLGGAWRGQNRSLTNFDDYTNTTLSQSPTDYKGIYGFSLNNFQTKAHEFNLELSLHLNRFTERTGLDPYIFGGIGATFYRSRGDLLDDSEYMYNYNLLDKYTNFDLMNFLNHDYETDLDGSHQGFKGQFMGHLGLGIGYYFTRNFSMGFEHKTTFSQVNDFDGVLSNHGKFKKDIYHYTSLYLKVYFNRKHTQHEQPENPRPKPDPGVTNPTRPVTPVTPPVDCPQPYIYLNTASNSTVNQPVFQISGRIQNASLQGISSTLNGIYTGDFIYNNREEFKSMYHLQPGLNTIVLNVLNNCGQKTQTIYVNYVPACDNPIVNFTNPRSGTTSVSNQNIAVQAKISHLGDGLIQLYVNGRQTNNFNYNNSTGILTSNVTLQNGNNTIQIIVSNSCGTNSQTVQVVYNRVCPSPVISMHSPAKNYGTTGRIELAAAIQNISNANQVDVYVNGADQGTGTYQNGTSMFKKQLYLSNGKNTIIIRATNSCGSTEHSLVYEVGQPCLEPTVAITNPSGPRATSNNQTYTIQASIRNVVNPQNIIFKVNNVRITSFNYSIQTGLFTASVQLSKGSNSIELSVNNECGYASASATVSYTPPCDAPTATWKQPASNITVVSEDFHLESVITNINSVNDVELTVNGVRQTAGTYTTATNVYRKSIKLKNGNNSIQLKAWSHCGEVTISINIYYKTVEFSTVNKPVIAYTGNCNVVVPAGIIKFTGNVTNVSETSQIVIKLNNIIQTDVVYTPITNGLSFELQTRAGYSKTLELEVLASNPVGTTTQKCSVSTQAPIQTDNEIVICHSVRGIKQTLTIRESQWEQYERAGATKGPCPAVDKDIVICLTKDGQNVTLTIKESQWADYQKMGAVRGACPETVDNDIVICLPTGKGNTTLTIKESQWADYQKKGAVLGECPEVVDNDIIICAPDGRGKATMTIKESQWPHYQSMGATLGECPIVDPEIVICLRNGAQLNTLTIKQSEWPDYQKRGAFLGPCPEVVDQDITICMPDGTGKFTTLTIKQSQWNQYQAKGATLGACQTGNVTNEDNSSGNSVPSAGGMLICIEENGTFVTKTILSTEWKKYQQLGATRGACKEEEETPDPGKIITTPVRRPPTIVNPTTPPPTTTTKPVTTPSKTQGRAGTIQAPSDTKRTVPPGN